MKGTMETFGIKILMIGENNFGKICEMKLKPKYMNHGETIPEL